MKRKLSSVKSPKIFLTCEHAGNQIPARYKNLFSKNHGVLRTHRGSDPGAFAVANELERLTRTKLYYTKISRLVVDMNRSPESETALSRWTKSLSEDERARIFETIYWPYRRLVDSKVKTALGNERRLAHVGIHSFSPYLDPSRKSCDIGLLFDPKSRFETRLCKQLKVHLERLFPDLGIRMNFPYRGDADGLTTDLRKKYRPTRYAGIEIEFNQALLRKLIKQNSLKAFALNFSLCLLAAAAET
jgi:predicted N-formylglutamate amidohydrolase